MMIFLKVILLFSSLYASDCRKETFSLAKETLLKKNKSKNYSPAEIDAYTRRVLNSDLPVRYLFESLKETCEAETLKSKFRPPKINATCPKDKFDFFSRCLSTHLKRQSFRTVSSINLFSVIAVATALLDKEQNKMIAKVFMVNNILDVVLRYSKYSSILKSLKARAAEDKVFLDKLKQTENATYSKIKEKTTTMLSKTISEISSEIPSVESQEDQEWLQQSLKKIRSKMNRLRGKKDYLW